MASQGEDNRDDLEPIIDLIGDQIGRLVSGVGEWRDSLLALCRVAVRDDNETLLRIVDAICDEYLGTTAAEWVAEQEGLNDGDLD